MIRLLIAALLFASLHAVADVTLTELTNNTPADADDVMGNFNALKSALPPSNCSTDQIINWKGNAWVCADMPNSSPYVWQYKGVRASSADLQIQDGAFYLIEGGASRELHFNGTSYNGETIVAPFYYMETTTPCWISVSSNTSGLFEFNVIAAIELADSHWALTTTSPQNVLNLTLGATYRLEVIGCQ
jgi:hypothetical protein